MKQLRNNVIRAGLGAALLYRRASLLRPIFSGVGTIFMTAFGASTRRSYYVVRTYFPSPLVGEGGIGDLRSPFFKRTPMLCIGYGAG